MVRSEVRHGNFLAYLLNPSRPHGFHSDVLRALLLAISRNTLHPGGGGNPLRPLDVHLMDIEQADVRREWRNIDLLIVLRSEKIVIPVELKIDSTQGTDQLQRYRRIVESEWQTADGWKHLNVFLTKHDEPPLDPDHWQPLRIRDLVNEFEPIAETAVTSAASESLRAYLRMLRRHHLEDERLEEIARKLWSRHREALDFLADRRPDAIGNLFDALKDRKVELAKSLCGPDLQVLPDADKGTILRFAYAKWDNLPGFRQADWTDSKRFILLELKRERSKINAYLYLGPGEEENRARYVSLLEKKRLHRPNQRVGRDWMCLAKSEMLGDQIDDDTDVETSIEIVTKSLQLFAWKIFDHFDPVLGSLTAAEIIG
ncbi:PD-(D/E)XK nuclease family protein [Mesorhizobium sp. 1B3]|uniref:PD-(D/E)XK nuclease family protein n=1 Tax=Mesorhizobium sp. 1B3 TaxID=3243599 RepID=UPI003D982637